MDILVVAGIVLMCILVSFIMTCRAKAKGKKGEDDSDEDVSDMAK
jgi:hypothetical protein